MDYTVLLPDVCEAPTGVAATAGCSGLDAFLYTVFSPVTPYHSFFAVHIAAFVIIGAIVLWHRGELTTPWALPAKLFPADIWTSRSSRHDIALYTINEVLYGLMFTPWVVFGVGLAWSVYQALTWLFGPMLSPWAVTTWVVVAFTIYEVVLTDFLLFVTHWMVHTFEPLWAFHKVHHSATVLTPITSKRFHLIETFQDGLTMQVVYGLHAGLGMYLTGDVVWAWMVLWINGFDFLWRATGALLRHSHIFVTYPRWLSHIFISPAMHQIHHSANPAHYDTNLGVVFGWWDWAAGTLYIPRPEEGETLVFGLHQDGSPEHPTFASLYTAPFVDLKRWALSQAGALTAR